MSEQRRQLDRAGGPDGAAAKPLFDEDATVVAQPVVPLDDEAVAEGVGAYVSTGTAPPAYERAWRLRTKLMLALVLGALFVGAVVGIVGVRLYQRSRAAAAQAEERERARAASEPAPQPSTEAASESAPEEVQSAEVPPPAPVNTKREPEGKPDAVAEAAPAREGRTAGEATPRRRSSGDEAERVTPVKQGKKGEREAERVATRPRVYEAVGTPVSSPEAERRARREEERLRRAERATRRERRARSVDSVRGIFEGGGEAPPR